MEFCKKCGNILLPKKKTDELFCRVCKESFPVGGKEKKMLEQYKKATASKREKEHERKRALKTAVVIATAAKNKSMTEDDREAYGELFELSGE